VRVLLRRDQVRYLVEGSPVLLLPALPESAALPALRLTEEGAVGRCDGWRIAARLALTVVDGPGGHGVVVQGATGPGEDAEHVHAWCEAVDRHAGAVVLAFDGWDERTPPDELLDLAQARGARGGSLDDVPPG
jgi:hypothetical protein